MSLTLYPAVARGCAVCEILPYRALLLRDVGFVGINGLFATLIFNVCSSGLMGFFPSLAAGGLMVPEACRAFIAIGLLGALTTFSSFVLDTGTLFQKKGLSKAAFYIDLSICLSLGSFGLCYCLVSLQS